MSFLSHGGLTESGLASTEPRRSNLAYAIYMAQAGSKLQFFLTLPIHLQEWIIVGPCSPDSKFTATGLTRCIFAVLYCMKPAASTTSAKLILSKAQAGIQALMEGDLAAKQYGDLAKLAYMADGLAKLSEIDTDSSPPTSSMTKRIVSDSKFDVAKLPLSAISGVSKKKSKVKSKKGYPRFEFRNDMIVKIGWSKKAKKEYEHNAPASAAIDLASHIKANTQAGRIWTVEDLGEVVLSSGESELPSYQLYLLIAWMRAVGILSKQGRSGYAASSGAEILRDVKKAVIESRIE